MTRIQVFVRSLLRSLGLKRKLSAAFQTISLIIGQIPQLAPFAGVFTAIAGWLGLAGVSHALVDAEANPEATNILPLPTIAAFFNALVLAADSVPALAAYKGLFLFIASVLSSLSSATMLLVSASKK